MANINIYGSLWNNLSNNDEKIIAFGTQIYGNGLPSTTAKLVTKDELTAVGLAGWSSGVVEGNQYDINRFFKAKITKIDGSIGSINTNISNIKNNYVPYTGATKDVNLGSHTITSLGFGLTDPKAMTSFDDGGHGTHLLINGSSTTNCMELRSIYTGVNLDWGFTESSLYDAIDFLHSNCVPYTGATANVNLGSHTITSAGFTLSSGTLSSAITGSTTINNNDSSIRLLVDAVDGKNQINLAGLYRTVKLVVDNANGATGLANTLHDHFHNLYNKVNNITNPLRFMGTVGSGGSLPTSNVSKGDMWHLNIDLKVGSVQYYAGDDLVCVDPSTSPIKWDLLGANIVRIEPKDITVDNLESWATS